MNSQTAFNQAFMRGFIKAAQEAGVHPEDLRKLASLGLAPAMMGAIPGAAAGGYLAYDRALQRREEEPNSIDPQKAALMGMLGGGALGGVAGTAAGGIGYDRGTGDTASDHRQLLKTLLDAYRY